jgi:hypothetical protein
MATQRDIFLPLINLIRSHQGKAPLRAEGEAPPDVTDVTFQGQETLLGKQKKKTGYQNTRLTGTEEAPASSWYKETLG